VSKDLEFSLAHISFIATVLFAHSGGGVESTCAEAVTTGVDEANALPLPSSEGDDTDLSASPGEIACLLSKNHNASATKQTPSKLRTINNRFFTDFVFAAAVTQMRQAGSANNHVGRRS
jgi:hypothetical protein